jgi:predicted Zn-dependent protease with MMP-like domain
MLMTWSDRLAPSLDDFAALAKQAFDALPDDFRKLSGDVVIRIDDFRPTRCWTAWASRIRSS